MTEFETALLAKLDEILDVLRETRPQPNVEPLLAEIKRVTNGFRFTVSSLLTQAELDLEEDDHRLSEVLSHYCDMNGIKLGRLFAAIEGPRLKRLTNGRDGWVWQLKNGG